MMLQNQKSATIVSAIKQVQAIYSKRGFTITTLLMDGQFEPIRVDLAALTITLTIIPSMDGPIITTGFFVYRMVSH